MESNDPVAYAAAKEIKLLTNAGELIATEAAKKASKQMAKLMQNMDKQEGRIEALKHHGLYLGIGAQFMETVAPLVNNMIKDFKEMGMEENQARVSTELFLAKVFMYIEDGVKKHDK